ncbi:hypothetical protein [Thauera humireducens]|uniref:hypothetical protein n=1 Tax=Thauera humireducens TaxID=1134435 RepID=UPI003C73F238
MGVVGILALLANAGVAMMLYRFRAGDANMRSVWLCSRNDAIGNLAVILAAAGVFGTGSALPDLVVALVMSGSRCGRGLSSSLTPGATSATHDKSIRRDEDSGATCLRQ